VISKPNNISAELISKLGVYLRAKGFLSEAPFYIVDSITKYIRKPDSTKVVGGEEL